MKYLKNWILIIAFMQISCSQFFDDNPKSKTFSGTDLAYACTIDPEILGRMLVEDAKTQIICLEQNFRQFEKYVERENRDYISEDEIGVFVSKFFQDSSAKIIGALKLLFKLNMLILNDRPDRLSTENIGRITKLLISSNKEAVILSRILKEINNSNFINLRDEFFQSLERFAKTTLNIIDEKVESDKDSDLNIREFFKDLNNLEGIEVDLETIDAYLFIKRLFVGGTKDQMTSYELKKFIRKMPYMATLAFELYFIGPNNFKNSDYLYKFYGEKIDELKNLLHPLDQNDILFTTKDLVIMIESLPGQEDNLDNYEKAIEIIKEKFLGGDKAFFTFKDIKNALSQIGDLSKAVFFNFITYDHPDINKKMENDEPITSLTFPKLKEYEIFSPIELENLKDNFLQLAVTNRFYRLSNGLQYYRHTNIRTKYGMNESYVLQWGVSKLLKAYGRRVADYGNQYLISTEDLNMFLYDFKPFLEAVNMWTENPATFAQNTLYLGDLFQAHSNGDNYLNLTETTEYFSLLLTAFTVGEHLVTNLKNYCTIQNGDEDNPTYTVPCYRRFFFDVLFTDLSYSEHFQTLYEFYQTQNDQVLEDFLIEVEKFARDNYDVTRPVSMRDILKVFGAVLCIESVLVRFDLNKNNLLDPREVDLSYNVYENIMMVLNGSDAETMEKYGFSAYKLFLRDTKRPTTYQILKFHYLPFQNRQIYAYRKNIAGLLSYVVSPRRYIQK